MDSMLPWVYFEIAHRKRQNGLGTSQTHPAKPRISHFDVICFDEGMFYH